MTSKFPRVFISPCPFCRLDYSTKCNSNIWHCLLKPQQKGKGVVKTLLTIQFMQSNLKSCQQPCYASGSDLASWGSLLCCERNRRSKPQGGASYTPVTWGWGVGARIGVSKVLVVLRESVLKVIGSERLWMCRNQRVHKSLTGGNGAP